MATKRLKPKESTVKSLFAKSGNQCSFSGCDELMVGSSGNVIGQICHIEAAKEGGPRFNSNQTNEERRKEENLILLCPTHHVVTDDEIKFTTPTLVEMKSSHENKMQNSTFSISDEIAKKAIENYFHNYSHQENTNSGSGTQNNYQVNNYNSPSHETQEDLGIISEIFDYVLDRINTGIGDDFDDNSYIYVEEKISLNFPNELDSEEVHEFFKYAYTKIDLITAKHKSLDTEDQKDIAAYIYKVYRSFMRANPSSIETLHALFDHFTPIQKKNNPKYVALSQAFVLFFFDDCTIFEKTVNEKTKQTKLSI